MGYVYMITCVKNNMSYIGVSVHKPEKRRIDVHLRGKGNKPLADDVEIYGQDAFVYEILESDVFPELLSDLEKFYIAKFNTVEPNGYNQTHGGLHENWRHSDATRQRMSDWQSKNHPMRGRKHSEESKRAMSKSRTGQRRTVQQRQNISNALMGHKTSQETRDKISHKAKGRKHSDEFRRAQSERFSGESNPMYGRKRTEDREYIEKISGDNSPMAHPYRKSARDFFDALSPEMSLKEKRGHLYTKFPDVKRSTIQHWTRIWIKETNPHANTDERTLPEKDAARELFFSLPTDMPEKEKRKVLYSKFPSVKRQTINKWTRKWSNSSTPKTRPEYHDVYKHYLSLPDDMSLPKKRQLLREGFPNTPKSSISKWVRKWSNTPASRKAMRHVDYDKAHNFFLSLPSDMNLKEKKRLLREDFPDISPASWAKWIKKWTGESTPVGAPSHSLRPEIYEYFLLLPQDMSISEKRKSIVEKFGNVVSRPLVNKWTRKWHTEVTGSPPPNERWYREPQNNHKKGKPAHNRRPEYGEAKDYFLHLSPGMPSSEKGRKLRKKYPHIPKGTISQWLHRWQSKLDTQTIS